MEAQLSFYWEKISTMTLEYLPKLALAVVVLWVGLRIIKKLSGWVASTLERHQVNPDIRPFFSTIVNISLKILLFFSVAGIVGIETTSFVAVLAAAGFAVGIALQGSLGNFAAGIIILVFRPYKVGDLIDVQGNTGYVEEIQIFNTVITTLDNRTIIIPNTTAANGVVTNLSTRKYLRLDIKINIPYNVDYPHVESLLLDALRQTPKVLDHPAPFVGIEKFDTHFLSLTLRPHAKTEDYWDVFFNAHRLIKRTLHDNNIPIAYPEGVEMGEMGR